MLPRLDVNDADCRAELTASFVNLSEAYRDLVIDISVSPLHPKDVASLRNGLQRVIRSVLAIKPVTLLFELDGDQKATSTTTENNDAVVNVQSPPCSSPSPASADAIKLVKTLLADPARALIDAMIEAVSCSDNMMTETFNFWTYHQRPRADPEALSSSLVRLKKAMTDFDDADSYLVGHPTLPPTYHDHPEVVDLFLFVHPVRQTADSVKALIENLVAIQSRKQGWKIHMPSHPLKQALLRTNAQVRHDRGGLTAGIFFQNKRALEKTMESIQGPTFERHDNSMRYRLWMVLHRLQGFESRFAFKTTLVTTLLSIPAWLPQSRDWWNANDVWWAVVMVWLMMHPR